MRKKLTKVIYVKYFIILLLFFFAIFVLYHLVVLLIILPWAPSDLVYVDKLESCELIVFLGGTYYERINYAFELAEKGYAKIIFSPNVAYEQSQAHLKQKLEQISTDISYFQGTGASSTYEEALATKEFIKQKQIKSFILVTSPYHSYRAQWIFKKVMPDIKIFSAPSNLENVNLSEQLESYYPKEKHKFLFYYIMYSWRIY